MKVQLLLIGVVAVLSLGALTLADSVPLAASPNDAPASSLSRLLEVSKSPEASPSPEGSPEPSDSPEASPTPESTPTPELSDTPATTSSAHPCNHGFYVSQAAHGRHGGVYTSKIARSTLGQNGDCRQPLPPPPAASTTSDQQASEASDQEGDSGT